jgi:capsular polysaccharide biosynthesis protein
MNPPDTQAAREPSGSGWRRAQSGSSGLERYFRVIRERLGLIAMVTLTTTLVAAAYLAVATEQYKAEADLLVIPASREDTALNGLPVIRESSDPTRDVETAARLVANRNVAKAVKEDLGLDQSVDSLLSQVTAEPVAQSNIVAVTATADSPDLARDLANGFVNGVVEQRSKVVKAEAEKQIVGLKDQLQEAEDNGEEANVTALANQIAELQGLVQSGDPTRRRRPSRRGRCSRSPPGSSPAWCSAPAARSP